MLHTIVAHSISSPCFKRSGIELLRHQLSQTHELRDHQLRHTSNRDLEEWISIMTRTIKSLEEELENR